MFGEDCYYRPRYNIYAIGVVLQVLVDIMCRNHIRFNYVICFSPKRNIVWFVNKGSCLVYDQ